ncbi:MAG TPA: hypothetical protein VNA28_16120 [Solirubrobacteraceae bacterium]|nr:hypothetical protein [Solirubrobacteraceae bacterium]
MATDVTIERPGSRMLGLPHGTLALAGLAMTAGVIHLVATVEHVTVDLELGLFFALVGAAQIAAGYRIHRKGADSRLLKLVALGSVALAVLWIFSRTTGIPVGPDAGQISKVGVGDAIATILELAFAALAGVILVRGEDGVAWLSGAIALRLTCALLSLSLMLAALGGHEH